MIEKARKDRKRLISSVFRGANVDGARSRSYAGHMLARSGPIKLARFDKAGHGHAPCSFFSPRRRPLPSHLIYSRLGHPANLDMTAQDAPLQGDPPFVAANDGRSDL